ncbi:MAG: PLP-dependent aminotransferase family protein [Bacillota bacterium]|nr:PLP-dependent aminotransferase family protein [Bacillota bacterium]
MKYEEVIQSVMENIKSGFYKNGTRLPSVRKMSSKYDVNKSTVIRAYEELEEKHVIYSIPKSGYYVIDGHTDKNSPDRMIDFSQITPDEKMLPFREFNHCINRAVDIYKSELFEYGDTQGLYSLRKATSNYFMTQNIYTKPDNICITNGAHQGFSILSCMNFPGGRKKILIEQPTYAEAQGIIEFSRCEFVTVGRNENGLDMKAVEKIFKEEDIKFFYTMSRFHNPLGTHLHLNQKKQLIELAVKYNVYIVEDDFLADIEAEGRNLPLFYYDINSRVIYLKSFSKSFMPGVRLGCVIVGDELLEEFLRVKRCYDINTSVLSQGALELFITSGMYLAQIRKIRNTYENKNKVFTEQIKYLDKAYRYIRPEESGYIFWMNLHNQIDSTVLTKKLLDLGVKVSDGKQFLVKDSDINGIRLSIASLSNEQVRHGIKTIYDSIKRE